MTKVLSFENFIQKTNEADLFGVTTSHLGNLPPGYDDSDSYEPEDLRGINPSNHELKLLATDYNEFGILEDKAGKKYVYYFDSSQPDFKEAYMIYNDQTEDYEEIDRLGVEAAANDVPKEAYGVGLEAWNDGTKEIIEIDEELADDLLDEFKVWVTRDGKKREVENALKTIASELARFNESTECSMDEEDESETDGELGDEEVETDGKPGYDEEETDETTEVREAEGIHPAIREKLMDYLKENPDATFPEAKKFISDKIAGWKLSQEDFEEAKKLM